MRGRSHLQAHKFSLYFYFRLFFPALFFLVITLPCVLLLDSIVVKILVGIQIIGSLGYMIVKAKSVSDLVVDESSFSLSCYSVSKLQEHFVEGKIWIKVPRETLTFRYDEVTISAGKWDDRPEPWFPKTVGFWGYISNENIYVTYHSSRESYIGSDYLYLKDPYEFLTQIKMAQQKVMENTGDGDGGK